MQAGLTFDEAFSLATDVRNALSETDRITPEALREVVTRQLRDQHDQSIVETYCAPTIAPSRILITGRNGSENHFSRARLERFLQASGLRVGDSEMITDMIHESLLSKGVDRLSTDALAMLIFACLSEEKSSKVARRFLLWLEFTRSERPLLLLVGGAVGSGKSTLATELAHRLEISRVQSTDMLREVMRTMIPRQLLPVLHVSSYEAWNTLPIDEGEARTADMLVADGFRSQAQLLEVSCLAVMGRACREGVSLILEGVHALPGLLERNSWSEHPVCVHLTLAVLHTGTLKKRLRVRGVDAPGRRVEDQLECFESIWALQSFLLDEADQCASAVISNEDFETTVREAALTIIRTLGHQFEGTLESALGSEAGEFDAYIGRESWRLLLPRLIAK